MIKVFIADDCVLIREGFKSLFQEMKNVELAGEASCQEELFEFLEKNTPDVLILDYCSSIFGLNIISSLLTIYPSLKILAISASCDRSKIATALKSGVSGHLLKDCDKLEITDAIYAISKGEKFYCGKVLDVIKPDDIEHEPTCAPISLSERELEVIKLISEGLTNKEIADMLYISAFTVMTHRKNIMNKLGISNTAGIVLYAVRENLISPNKFLFASSS